MLRRKSKRRTTTGVDGGAAAAATMRCAALASEKTKSSSASGEKLAAGRALVKAIRRSSLSSSSQQSFNSCEGTIGKSVSDGQGKSDNGGIARGGSWSGTTASLSSSSLSPISVDSSVSSSCPTTLQVKPQQLQSARCRQSPAPSLTSLLSSSQHSASNPGNNASHVVDDDQVISRLENECIKLNLAMSRLRKYTQEWFLLETRLKTATEELEAAKEDRELHCYLGSSPAGEVGSVLGSARGSEVGGRVGNGVGDVADKGERSGGIGIPETVLLHHVMMGESERVNGVAKAEMSDHRPQELIAAEVKDEQKQELNEAAVNSQQQLERNEAEVISLDREERNELDEIRLEYERVESELNKVSKFSPEWFRLKEELVELSITLNAEDEDEDDEANYEPHDKPKEIEVVNSVRPCTFMSGGAPGTNRLYFMEGDEEEVVANDGGGSYRKKGFLRQDSSLGSSNSPVVSRSPISSRSLSPAADEEVDVANIGSGSYRRKGLFLPDSSLGSSSRSPTIASRSLSPITPASPPPTQGRAQRGSASPYHESSDGGGSVASQRHCLSPYHSVSNGSGSAASSYRSSPASHNYCYSRRLLLGDGRSFDEDDAGDGDRSPDDEKLEGTIADLRARHAEAFDELNCHPKFSKEWFVSKTEVVGLEDQIEELESSRSAEGSSPGGSGSNPKNTSFTSGWSSNGAWSESEEEVMSYADDLECVMVAEALNQLNQRRMSPYDGSDNGEEEAEFEYDEELLGMMRVGKDNVEFDNHMNTRVASATKIQALVRGGWQRDKHRLQRENATKIQSFLRKGQLASKYRRALISIATIQRAWRSYQVQESLRPGESAKSMELNMFQSNPDLFDSMLDEFAFMLGQEDDDEVEKRHFYATTIQEWWHNCCTCRPALSNKRRALSYKGWVGAEKQQLHLQQQLNHHSAWQIISVVLIQAHWRGCHARDEFLKIQSVIRERRQHEQYRQLRENSIIIQSFLRKAQASIQFKHAVSSIVRIQRFWRDMSRKEPATAERVVAFSDLELLFQHMEEMLSDEWDDVYEKQNYYALTLQDQWRNFKRCKKLVSMRRRALQYQALTGGEGGKRFHFEVFAAVLIQTRWRVFAHRRGFNSVKVTVLEIQTMIRAMRQRWWYNRQREKAIVIQSFLRGYWMATGKVYMYRREVLFHSAPMGIRLRHGKDGFVRVLSVVEADATAIGTFVVREGTIQSCDIVMEAAGIDLRSPIAKDEWGRIVEQIRNAPRPMKFIVAGGTGQLKAKVLEECQHALMQLQCLLAVLRIQRIWRTYCCLKHLQASIVIQSHVRRWLAHKKELEKAALLTECKAMLMELKSLQAAILVQSHTRRWLAHSSFSCKRNSIVRIQAFLQMKSQNRRYRQTLTNVTLIQGLAEEWLIRRNGAATLIQSNLRRWLARSSFSQKWESSARIQAFLLMHLQRRQYKQMLTNAILTIQRFARGLLVRRNLSGPRSLGKVLPDKLEQEVMTLSVQLVQMQESSPVWQESANKVNVEKDELCNSREEDSFCDAKYSMGHEELKEVPSERDESNDSPEKPINFWLLRQHLERKASAPIFLENENKPPSNGVDPTGTKPYLTAESSVTSQAYADGPHQSPENEENELVSNARSSVAMMRQTLEAKDSIPIFPENEVSAPRSNNVPAHSPPWAPVPEARAGEMWSPKTELHGVNYSQNFEKFERCEAARTFTMESTRPSRSGKKKQCRKTFAAPQTKKKLTPEEKMRSLSIECVNLSARVKSLPKFSPEWTLSKLEMKLISDELEYLYAESMAKGAHV